MAEHTMCSQFCVHEEAVQKAKDNALTWQQAEDIVLLHKMMADHTRLRVLWALMQGEMCVCDVAVALDMSKAAVSHHLNALRRARLVTPRRAGKSVYYSLTDEHVVRILTVSLTHIREEYLEK